MDQMNDGVIDGSKHQEQIERLGAAIKGIRVAMLTTLDPDGVLRSRPMGTQDTDFDGQLWFFTQEHSGKVHSIENEQHVNVSYADKDKNLWVSIAGRANLVKDKEKIRELWSPALKAWFPKGLEDPELSLLCVDVESAQIWDSPSGAFVMLAGFLKATLTGKSYDKNAHSDKIQLQ